MKINEGFFGIFLHLLLRIPFGIRLLEKKPSKTSYLEFQLFIEKGLNLRKTNLRDFFLAPTSSDI